MSIVKIAGGWLCVSAVLSLCESSPNRPFVDCLFGKENLAESTKFHVKLDVAVARRGAYSSGASAFLVGLWSNPQSGLEELEKVLGQPVSADDGK